MCLHPKKDVVNLSVPTDRLEDLFEAIEKAEKEKSIEGVVEEEEDFFVSQNAATRKLGNIVKETYDAMLVSLTKELKEALK